MSQKKFQKKLSLGKTTIAHLNHNELSILKGGASEYASQCGQTCNGQDCESNPLITCATDPIQCQLETLEAC